MPVFRDVSVHDPSVIRADGMYYIFGSHMAAAKSADLMNWTMISRDAGSGCTLVALPWAFNRNIILYIGLKFRQLVDITEKRIKNGIQLIRHSFKIHRDIRRDGRQAVIERLHCIQQIPE